MPKVATVAKTLALYGMEKMILLPSTKTGKLADVSSVTVGYVCKGRVMKIMSIIKSSLGRHFLYSFKPETTDLLYSNSYRSDIHSTSYTRLVPVVRRNVSFIQQE